MSWRDDEPLPLTDAEWMSLIDGSEERGGLVSCCANISALRDAIMELARMGGRDVLGMSLGRLAIVWGAAASSHDLDGIPALDKLRDALGIADRIAHVRDDLSDAFEGGLPESRARVEIGPNGVRAYDHEGRQTYPGNGFDAAYIESMLRAATRTGQDTPP